SSHVSVSEYPFLTQSQPGDVPSLGTYSVLKVLGRGGMGVVFHGWDPSLRRSVAIKVILPDVANDPCARRRILRAAQALPKLHHDNITQIFQVDDDKEMTYIVMPFLKGITLQEYLNKHKGSTLPLKQILRIGREIAMGLAAAHAEGVIHRDIKPANLWLDADSKDRVIILHWALARPDDDNTHLTHNGALVGTPAYMAPEQARGEKNIDARVDIYSLGAILYQMSTGQRPFSHSSVQ